MADTAVHGAAKLKAGALKGYGQVVSGTQNAMEDELNRYERSLDKILGKTRGDWSKKLSQGTWGMRKKAHEVWYENGKLRKESRSELFAVAKDASEIDFWDVLEVIGNFLLGVLLVIGAILLVLVLVWAIGALLASLGAWLVALTAEYAIGSLVAALVVGIEMLITSILSSTVFWVAASSYGIYSGYKTIKEAKNNPNLTRSDAAYEYGSGTAEIILSIIPFWSKFKGKLKTNPPKSTPKQNYENYGGEFEDDFARMGTQQEPLMNKPSANRESISEVNDFAKNKKSGKFAKESSLEKGVNGAGGFTLQQIDDYVALATKQGNQSKVMLGKFEINNPNSYNVRAGSDHAYFDMGPTNWAEAESLVGGSVDEMWRINKKFIDNRKALGNDFYLSHDPANPNYYKGFYKMEIDYLTNPISQGGLGGTIVDQGNNLWRVVW